MMYYNMLTLTPEGIGLLEEVDGHEVITLTGCNPPEGDDNSPLVLTNGECVIEITHSRWW
jgi:hypothetical protein